VLVQIENLLEEDAVMGGCMECIGKASGVRRVVEPKIGVIDIY
jgi:hypothetical protein